MEDVRGRPSRYLHHPMARVSTAMKTTSFTTLYSYGVRKDAAVILPVSVTQY